MNATHDFRATLPTPVNILADRRGIHPTLGWPIKVKRGWPAFVCAQCHCGCRQYRVTVLDLVDVILPVEVLRTPHSTVKAQSVPSGSPSVSSAVSAVNYGSPR